MLANRKLTAFNKLRKLENYVRLAGNIKHYLNNQYKPSQAFKSWLLSMADIKPEGSLKITPTSKPKLKLYLTTILANITTRLIQYLLTCCINYARLTECHAS